jgi:hypothetical protein
MWAGLVVGQSSALTAELRGPGAKTPALPVRGGDATHQQALTHRSPTPPTISSDAGV